MIRKFRNLEEMNAAQQPKLETDPERLYQRLSGLSVLATALCPAPGFRGVHKFRNMEEHNQFRLEWMRARVKRMREAEEKRKGQASSQKGGSSTT